MPFFMDESTAKIKFEKGALTFSQQIELLESRGMVFDDKAKAERYLSNISYYRLSAYWFTFLEHPSTDHKFRPGTRFEQVISTYVFDRKLRLLIFDEIERIEIAFRTQLIYSFAHAHGNNWYEDVSLFIDEEGFSEAHTLLVADMEKSREKFIPHYKGKYGEPTNPPCWMALEIASMGWLSIIYKNLRGGNAKKQVAEHFFLDDTVFISWLQLLCYLRNTCAHHSRLWNRGMQAKLKFPQLPMRPWLSVMPVGQHRFRLYTALAAIFYLLKGFLHDSSFAKKLKELLDEYPELPRHYMGFPERWEEDPFWQLKS